VADQDLLKAAPDLADRRLEFRHELQAILQDFDHVGHIARKQFVARETEARSAGRHGK
jgi:glycerol-3-phosphate O-acyltransferase